MYIQPRLEVLQSKVIESNSNQNDFYLPEDCSPFADDDEGLLVWKRKWVKTAQNIQFKYILGTGTRIKHCFKWAMMKELQHCLGELYEQYDFFWNINRVKTADDMKARYLFWKRLINENWDLHNKDRCRRWEWRQIQGGILRSVGASRFLGLTLSLSASLDAFTFS